MELQFNAEIAAEYGVDEAIFIQSVGFWLRKNRANNANFVRDRYWTYNTRKALHELFPFWSPRQLERITSSCVAKDLLLVEHPDGPTKKGWYSLTDRAACLLGLDLSPNGEKYSPNGEKYSPNGEKYSPNGEKPFKRNTKKEQSNTKKYTPAQAEEIFFAVVGDDKTLRDLVSKFIAQRWKMKKPYKTASGPTAGAAELVKLSGGRPEIMRQLLQKAIDREWLTFYPLSKEDLAALGIAPTESVSDIPGVDEWD